MFSSTLHIPAKPVQRFSQLFYRFLFRKDLHLSVFPNFIPEITSLLREMISFVREMASLLREMTSPKREMASLLREIVSLLREMASFVREMLSREREMASFVREMTSPTGISTKNRPFIDFFKYETHTYLPDLYFCIHPIFY
jgi:hypothetical protein